MTVFRLKLAIIESFPGIFCSKHAGCDAFTMSRQPCDLHVDLCLCSYLFNISSSSWLSQESGLGRGYVVDVII